MLGYLWEDLLDNIDKFKLFSNKLGVSPFCLKLVLRCILLFALLETTKVSRVLWGASLSFFLVSFLAFLIFVFNLSIRFGWEGLNEYCYMKYLRRSIYLMDLILRLSLLFYIKIHWSIPNFEVEGSLFLFLAILTIEYILLILFIWEVFVSIDSNTYCPEKNNDQKFLISLPFAIKINVKFY